MLRLRNISLMTFVLLLALSCSKQEQLEKPQLAADEIELRGKAVSQTTQVINAVTGEVAGEARLVRNDNGITMQFEANDLIPSHTYTIWWVVWNKPENCAGSPCADTDFALPVEVEVLYAAGHVVGGSGKGKFTGHLKVGDDSESINALFGLPPAGGLQDAKAAEIHLVLRSHGPKIPGLVNEQISSYEGGCTTNFPPFTAIPAEEGECGDFEFAIFLPVS
mgnify:CR=1 FL=1